MEEFLILDKVCVRNKKNSPIIRFIYQTDFGVPIHPFKVGNYLKKTLCHNGEMLTDSIFHPR